MTKDWKMAGPTRAFIAAFWVLIWLLIVMGIIINSVETLLDPSVLVALVFGVLGMASVLHGALTKVITRHLMALARLKYILNKLQSDESGCIRRAVRCRQNDQLRLRFELGQILSRYELMYAEIADYMKGGTQPWVLE